MYAFYCGYKGMATRNGRLTDYYVCAGFSCCFSSSRRPSTAPTITAGATPGARGEKMSIFLGWTFFESTMWTLVPAGAAALYRVVTTRKDAMRSQGASGYGLRV